MKFLCNGMLGKLCKYLRICGIDTLYSNEGMKAFFLAKKENRIFLTRNTQLKDKEGVFFIESEVLPIQLNTIIKHFNLDNELNFFTRCLCCNELLVSIDKEGVKGVIPYYTYKNYNEFARCPRCHRVYWKGSHYQKMIQDIKKLIG
ncbi:MAG: Mut7-C RNAse domain-containing protein [candidate division WOR-3 bacterium]